MPISNRFFPVTQDINGDHEVWELTEEFGDRTIRLWLEILSICDRSKNVCLISDQWLASVSRRVRQTPATVSRAIGWMLAKGWLDAGQLSASGSPTSVGLRNYAKYHRTRDAKKNDFGSPPNRTEPNRTYKEEEGGAERPPSGGSASLKLVEKPTPKVAPIPKLTDQEFLAGLKKNPAYTHIDIDRELSKADAWIAANPGRQKNRRFIVNWLNRIEKPMAAQSTERKLVL